MALLPLVDPNFVDDLGFNPLHYATWHNQPGILYRILENSHTLAETINAKCKFSKLDPEVSHFDEMSLLHYACLCGYSEIVKLLVGCNKVDVNATTSNKVYTRLTALHLLISEDLLNFDMINAMSLSSDSSPNQQNSPTQEMLRQLLNSQRIDVNVKTDFSLERLEWSPLECYLEDPTPLHLCILHKNLSLFDILIQDKRTDLTAQINLVSDENLTAHRVFPVYFLGDSFNDGSGYMAEDTLDDVDSYQIYRVRNISPLHLATIYSAYEFVEKLVEKKVDLDVIDSNHDTALHSVLDVDAYFHQMFRRNLWNNSVMDFALLLIQHHANIDICNARITIRQLIYSERIVYRHAVDLVEAIEAVAYEADTEVVAKPKNQYKRRLLLGEGDFSYTKALLKKHEAKHPGLAKAITATEYQPERNLGNFYENSALKGNLQYAKEKGATILFDVDATNLQKTFPHQKFDRIHFNCPYVSNADSTKQVVYGFFKSANKLQDNSKRVHISLVDSNRYFWHGVTYGIVDASSSAGYKLIKKRDFGKERYPGYEHKQSPGGNRQATSSKNAQYAKEFIFEKTNLAKAELLNLYRTSGMIDSNIETKGKQDYFVLSTDKDDSSDYVSDVKTPVLGKTK